jgi:hypothetical protein
VEPSGVAEALCYNVKVASLAPNDYNSVKYTSKIPELYLWCDASYDSRICGVGFLVTPSKNDGDGGKRDLEGVGSLKSEYFFT